MRMIHDDEWRANVQTRIRTLRQDQKPRWGKMSVDQMLWHVSDAMEMALGKRHPGPRKPPLPAPVMKVLVLNLPWPKGLPTLPEFVAKRAYDFDAERHRCLALIDEMSRKALDSPWADHPAFGKVDGRFNSRFHAKHLNHHLTQFGA
jgi:hypothetical protein